MIGLQAPESMSVCGERASIQYCVVLYVVLFMLLQTCRVGKYGLFTPKIKP